MKRESEKQKRKSDKRKSGTCVDAICEPRQVNIRGSEQTERWRKAAKARGISLTEFVAQACQAAMDSAGPLQREARWVLAERLVALRRDLNSLATLRAETTDEAAAERLDALVKEVQATLKAVRACI